MVPQGFLLRWVIVYVVAAGVGGAISGFGGRIPLSMGLDFETFRLVSRVVGLTGGVLAAALLAFAQWRLLRDVLLALSVGAWVGAAAAAALLRGVLTWAAQSFVGPAAPGSAAFIPLLLVSALITGGAQYWVLRRYAADAIAWPLAFVAGSLTGTLVVTLLGPALVRALGGDSGQAPALPSFAALVVLLPALGAIAPALATGWAIPRLAPR